MKVGTEKNGRAKGQEPLISMAGPSRQNLERYLAISEQVRELEEANEELKKLISVKDQLLSIISHDVRAPLASIKSLLTLFSQQKLIQDGYREVAEGLNLQIEQTNRFLENLLQWTKKNFSKIKPRTDKVALQPLVEEVIALYSFSAHRKKVAIASEVSEELTIYADAEMIKLVLRNLISNAIKFCNQNNHIYIQAITVKRKVRVSVKDTGQGISEKNMTTLFGLSHVSTTGTKDELGFGLGLALCKDFVEKMGGHISASSKEGKGSCFEFTVPSPA
jgi:two-component system sensor histidine kinase/response regulator